MLLGALALAACGEPKREAGASSSSPSSTASPSSSPDKPAEEKRVAPLSVDNLGPSVGAARVDMKQDGALDKLTRLVKAQPIDGKPVVLLADKKARTPDVMIMVNELAAAGAPSVTIKTDGRDDLAKEIKVFALAAGAGAPGCSVSATVMKDLGTGVWPAKGAVAKRQAKGQAGPDLTFTGETLERDLAACASDVAFVSGDDSLLWELTYNLAATVVKSDKTKKLTKLVLAKDLVAGRPVPGVGK